MTKNKATENSAFATQGSGAAVQPAKALSLKKKTSRSRKPLTEVEVPATEVAADPDAQLESTTRSIKPKTARAKSTAVTHRHKKLEIAHVAELEQPLRVEFASAVEPTNDEIAALAYSYYVSRGYQDGNQADDWFRAVTELRAKIKA